MADEKVTPDHDMPSEKEHTIFELRSLKSTLNLSEGDKDAFQAGGSYKEVRTRLANANVEGYEVHHMPSNAVQNASADELPAIAMKVEDHAQTDSYRGRQNSKLQSFLPGGSEGKTYRNETASMIENGRYSEVVRDEVYNIKDCFGDKYDAALAEYLDSVIDYVSENGVPEPVYSKDYNTEANETNGEKANPADKKANNANKPDAKEIGKKSEPEHVKAGEKGTESASKKAADKAGKADKAESKEANATPGEGGKNNKSSEKGKKDNKEAKESDNMSRDSFLDSLRVGPKKMDNDPAKRSDESNSEGTDESAAPNKGQRERTRNSPERDSFLESISVKNGEKDENSVNSHDSNAASKTQGASAQPTPAQSGSDHGGEGGHGGHAESEGGGLGEGGSGGRGEGGGGGHCGHGGH